MKNSIINHKKIAIVLILGFLIISPVAAESQGDLRKLHRLNTHMSSIEQTYRSGRILGGSILIGLGVVFGTGSTIAAFSIRDIDSYFMPVIIGAGIGFGVLCGLTGGISLVFPSEFEKLSGEYNQLPENSEKDIQSKISAGEIYFEKLYNKAQSGRMLNAGIMACLGITSVVVSFLIADSLNSNYFDTNYLLLNGLGDIGIGLMNLLIKTPVEKEYEAYRKWEKNRNTVNPAESSLQLRIKREENGMAVFICLLY